MKPRIAALLAVGPCCFLLAVACGGTDYLDSPGVGSPDGATHDGPIGPGDGAGGDGAGGDGSGGDGSGDGAPGDGSGQDADAALLDGAMDADALTGNVPSLGAAKSFAVLGGQTVTNSGAGTTIGGNLGVSPGSAVTGIPVGQPMGAIHVGNDAVVVQAQLDLTTLYDDLKGRACPASNVLTGQDLAGKTLLPGVYCFSSSAAIGVGALVLDANNDPNAYWVFQIGSTLDVAASTVTLINGGTPCNIFWQVGSSVTVLDNAKMGGNFVAFSDISLNTGAVVTGRALARNGAVTLLSNQVSKAVCPP